MNVISLSPPYGTLIALLLKRIETRGWATSHRGPLGIHQTAAPGPKGTTEAALWELCASEPFRSALASKGITSAAQLPRGKIVAVGTLVGCYPIWPYGIGPMDDGNLGPLPPEPERSFGDYSPDRWAWFFSDDARSLAEPIAARGMPGLWRYDGGL